MLFPDLNSVERYLNSLINYEHAYPLGGARDRPKLEPTYRAVERLGLSLSLPHCAHIAGTKGKGSVVSFLEAMLSPEARVLSFTSPHLESFTERVRFCGKPLEDRIWCDGVSEIVDGLSADPAINLTYFEMTWIFCLWVALHFKSDVNIIEAGLGGKWDATNVLTDTLAVLTPVDYDHTDVLGNTLSEIARDKSGIIKPHARVIVSRQSGEAHQVYKSAIESHNAKPFHFETDYGWTTGNEDSFDYHDSVGSIPGLTLATPGLHQRDNAATAICAARLLWPKLSADSIRARLAKCIVPARQQLLLGTPQILLDVAHNPVSFRALANTLREHYSGKRIIAVMGMMKNKDARASLSELRGLISEISFVELNSPRSASPEDLTGIACELGFNAVTFASREEAFAELHSTSHDFGLVVGSFYLAGDYLSWRRNARIA